MNPKMAKMFSLFSEDLKLDIMSRAIILGPLNLIICLVDKFEFYMRLIEDLSETNFIDMSH